MKCNVCHVEKEETEFHFRRADRGIRFRRCKACQEVYRLAYTAGIKSQVLKHYGEECACCGEVIPEFLTIDHIDGSGATHRKTLVSKGGYGFYLWLIRNKFPSGFQTLCWNCNIAKGLLKQCPHGKRIKS